MTLAGLKQQLKLVLISLGLSAFYFPSIKAESLFLPEIMNKAFTAVKVVPYGDFHKTLIVEAQKKSKIKTMCSQLGKSFKSYKWDSDPCGTVEWKTALMTPTEQPLIWAEFGEGTQTTLILGGVHPDELTPIPLAFRFARYLKENPDLYTKKDIKIIVAPLVNPDGFLREHPTRTNLHGVDLNRNFFTQDWYQSSLKSWRQNGNSKMAHFPGYFPNSEIETLFQVRLIEEFSPDKILSLHAPLGFLDYDGPGDGKGKELSDSERKAKQLADSISRKSKNYRVVDYSFYPGSLGNYAGNERQIPTITLELGNSSPAQLNQYWEQFLPGFIQTVDYPFSQTKGKKLGEHHNNFNIFTHPEQSPTKSL